MTDFLDLLSVFVLFCLFVLCLFFLVHSWWEKDLWPGICIGLTSFFFLFFWEGGVGGREGRECCIYILPVVL